MEQGQTSWIKTIGLLIRGRFSALKSNKVGIGVLQALPLWVASLFTGLIAVAYTKLFGFAEYGFHWLYKWKDWSLFLFMPLFFLLAWVVVHWFAPGARGSGIPQVMAAIDLATPPHENRVGLLLSTRILLVKIVSSILMVLGGGAIGREGPTIQIAGSIFRQLNRWIPRSWPKLSMQSFLLTGGAAGLAAAFNTPLGGMVFAMEELAKIHLRHFRTALFSAVIIAGLTAQALLGPYLYLGYPEVRGLPFISFFAVALAALVSGVLGSLMCKMILWVMKWKQVFSTRQQLAFVLATGLSLAAIAYFLNSAVLGSGKDLMNGVLFDADKKTGWDTVALRLLGPVLCFNTGAAGGVFAPALAAGASVGAWLSGLLHMEGAGANILILSGMVGFLTGVTRTPFTSAILVLEMTDRHSVIFHLMLAALISNLAALLIDKRSLYDRLKKNYVNEVLASEKKE